MDKEKKWWSKMEKKNNPIDDGVLLNEGLSTVKYAIEEDKKGNYLNAIQSYQKAILLFETLVEQTEDINLRSVTRVKIDEYLKRTRLLLNLNSNNSNNNHNIQSYNVQQINNGYNMSNHNNYQTITRKLEGIDFNQSNIKSNNNEIIPQNENKNDHDKNINTTNNLHKHNEDKEINKLLNNSKNKNNKAEIKEPKMMKSEKKIRKEILDEKKDKIKKGDREKIEEEEIMRYIENVKNIEDSSSFSEYDSEKMENYDNFDENEKSNGKNLMNENEISPQQAEEMLFNETQVANEQVRKAFHLHDKINKRIQQFNYSPSEVRLLEEELKDYGKDK